MKAALPCSWECSGDTARYSLVRSIYFIFLSEMQESYPKACGQQQSCLLNWRERFQLHYLLAVDSGAFESRGGVGASYRNSCWCAVVTQGIPIAYERATQGDQCPVLAGLKRWKLILIQLCLTWPMRTFALPSWSYLRDLRKITMCQLCCALQAISASFT